MLKTDVVHVLIVLTFIIGYSAIILESTLKINKTAPALLMAVLTWMFLFLAQGAEESVMSQHLSESVSSVTQVIFFLLGAMALVELIDSHKGFRIITDLIQTSSKKKLLWLLGILTFFLSAVLDNLTTSIVMVSLLRKLVEDQNERMRLGIMVVIAANAGGAWTPIGDVTTTMLWIAGNITTLAVMKTLFFPSIASLIVALLLLGRGLKGSYSKILQKAHREVVEPGALMIFFCGLGVLIFVPIFKALTGLPPFMGIFIGLGVLWVITDLIHREETHSHLRFPHILSRIDTSGILFFLGILLCVCALESAGLLVSIANFLDHKVRHVTLVATLIGLMSSVIDNVPLVAAGIKMYDLQTYPLDSSFWQLLAYCAGTGGSILIVGSAAGVALMSLEKISFLWYLQNASSIAFLSYISGILVYVLQQSIG